MSEYERECEYADELAKKMIGCPFCGAKGAILHYENDGYLPNCTECDGMIEKWFDTPEEALAAWNMRYRND